MKLEELDKNFAVQTTNGKTLVFLPMTTPEIEVDGLMFFAKEHQLCRLSLASVVEQTVGVQDESWMPAGVQVRFKTNSKIIGVKYRLRRLPNVGRMPLSGNSGFDLYLGQGSNKRFAAVTSNEYGSLEYSSMLMDMSRGEPAPEVSSVYQPIPGTDLREVTINFPTYNILDDVSFGLEPGSEVLPPTPFAIEKPIAFYGSSITQGGCSSRPGNTYIQHLSRRLDAHVVNLGFSGCARAEEPMNRFLSSLDLSALVIDYDHNAPSAEYLNETHEKLFKTVRAAHPELPILLVTRPDTDLNLVDSNQRLEVVRATYQHALDAGDRNVYFVDGRTLFGDDSRDACTVDGCHPNDLGFYRMANVIEPILRQALGV